MGVSWVNQGVRPPLDLPVLRSQLQSVKQHSKHWTETFISSTGGSVCVRVGGRRCTLDHRATRFLKKKPTTLANSTIQATFYLAALLFIIKASKQHGRAYAGPKPAEER